MRKQKVERETVSNVERFPAAVTAAASTFFPTFTALLNDHCGEIASFNPQRNLLAINRGSGSDGAISVYDCSTTLRQDQKQQPQATEIARSSVDAFADQRWGQLLSLQWNNSGIYLAAVTPEIVTVYALADSADQRFISELRIQAQLPACRDLSRKRFSKPVPFRAIFSPDDRTLAVFVQEEHGSILIDFWCCCSWEKISTVRSAFAQPKAGNSNERQQHQQQQQQQVRCGTMMVDSTLVVFSRDSLRLIISAHSLNRFLIYSVATGSLIVNIVSNRTQPPPWIAEVDDNDNDKALCKHIIVHPSLHKNVQFCRTETNADCCQLPPQQNKNLPAIPQQQGQRFPFQCVAFAVDARGNVNKPRLVVTCCTKMMRVHDIDSGAVRDIVDDCNFGSFRLITNQANGGLPIVQLFISGNRVFRLNV